MKSKQTQDSWAPISLKELRSFIDIAKTHQRIQLESTALSDMITKAGDKINELMKELETNRTAEIDLYKKLATKYNVSIDIFKQTIIDILSTSNYDNDNNSHD